MDSDDGIGRWEQRDGASYQRRLFVPFQPNRAGPSPWNSVASASAIAGESRSAPTRRSSRAPGQLPSRGRGLRLSSSVFGLPSYLLNPTEDAPRPDVQTTSQTGRTSPRSVASDVGLRAWPGLCNRWFSSRLTYEAISREPSKELPMKFRVVVCAALSLLGQIGVACAEPRAWIRANSGDLVRL